MRAYENFNINDIIINGIFNKNMTLTNLSLLKKIKNLILKK